MARWRFVVVRYGRPSGAISYTGRSKCWPHATVQQWSTRYSSTIAIFHTSPAFDDRPR